MKPEAAVTKIVSLLKGGSLKLGDYTLKLPGGGSLDIAVSQVGGDLSIVFTGKKPVTAWFVFRGQINGLVICAKGIKVDISALPKRADPFIPWEKLGEL